MSQSIEKDFTESVVGSFNNRSNSSHLPRPALLMGLGGSCIAPVVFGAGGSVME